MAVQCISGNASDGLCDHMINVARQALVDYAA